MIALALNAWSESSGSDIASDVVVKVKPERVGSWQRGEIRVEPDGRRLRTGYRGGTLHLGRRERARDLGHRREFGRLVELLGG